MARELHRARALRLSRLHFALTRQGRKPARLSRRHLGDRLRRFHFDLSRRINMIARQPASLAQTVSVGTSSKPRCRNQLMAPTGLELELKIANRRRRRQADPRPASRTGEVASGSCPFAASSTRVRRRQDLQEAKATMKSKLDLLKLCATFVVLLLLPVASERVGANGAQLATPAEKLSVANTMDLLQDDARKGKSTGRIIHPLVVVVVVVGVAICCSLFV